MHHNEQMIRYLKGEEFSDTVQVDGKNVFRKGCFNCNHLIEKHSNVSGKCELVWKDDYQVWKDFTCENHDPISPGALG